MATYANFLAQQGLNSSKANAQRWRNAGKPPVAGVPRNRPTYSYGGAINTDPLQIPYGGQQIWQGTGRPNMAHLAAAGYSNITPLARQDGGYSVYGVPTDPTPAWAKADLADIRNRGAAAQQFASGTVMPWLAQQTQAVNQIQSTAQSNFAGLVNQSQQQIAGQAAQAGPGGVYGHAPGMAPFQTSDALHDQLGLGAAQSRGAAAGYQGALGQLQGADLAQGVLGGFAGAVARIPDQYEQKAQQFMQQLAPILNQIQQNRDSGEWNRRQALEQRRQFNASNAIEQQIAGGKAAADQQQFAYGVAKDNRDFQYGVQHDQQVLGQRAALQQQRLAAQAARSTAGTTGNKSAQKQMQAALLDARSALHGVPGELPHLTYQQWLQATKLPDNATSQASYARNPTDPNGVPPTVILSATDAARQLVAKHGVDLKWAYNIARRLGYKAKPGQWISPQYQQPGPHG